MWNISWNPNNLLEKAVFCFVFFSPRKGSAKDWGICTFLQVGEQEGFHRTLEAFTVEKARIHSGKHFTSQSTALQKAKIFLPPSPPSLKVRTVTTS